MTVRLNFEVEGQTEQGFVAQVLRPHLAKRNIWTANRLVTNKRKGGCTYRGGMRKYLPAKNEICRWLKEDSNSDARFTTMFDLYALPQDFPGFNKAKSETDPRQRVEILERALAADIDDRRFIPYIQLHEFEALLLAYPTAFACRYPDRKQEIERLERLCADYETPEMIDDGSETAPSKRIGREIPEYLAAKPTAGPLIALEIGLDRIRAKCPHFNDWLTKLESLATG